MLVLTNRHANSVPNQPADETKLKMMQEVSENFEVSLMCFPVSYCMTRCYVSLVVSGYTGSRRSAVCDVFTVAFTCDQNDFEKV